MQLNLMLWDTISFPHNCQSRVTFNQTFFSFIPNSVVLKSCCTLESVLKLILKLYTDTVLKFLGSRIPIKLGNIVPTYQLNQNVWGRKPSINIQYLLKIFPQGIPVCSRPVMETNSDEISPSHSLCLFLWIVCFSIVYPYLNYLPKLNVMLGYF